MALAGILLKPRPLAFTVYFLFSLVFVASAVIPPLSALGGYDEVASASYNAAAPLCHQWIYRSYCLFETGGSLLFDECIPEGSDAVISTRFTYSPRAWDGEFEYSRSQIGRNRAEHVVRDGMEGYKFGVCSRDLFMYFGLMLAALAFLVVGGRVFKRSPHIAYAIVGIVPMGVDGMGQLLGLWESTNIMRAATGLIAVATVGFYIVMLLYEILKGR